MVAALLALSILTLIGLSMTFVSSTEVLINQNNRMKLVNLYLAESASEEARDRIKDMLSANQLSVSDSNKVVYIVSDPGINPTAGDSTSNPYFDAAYQSGLPITILPSDLASLGFAWVKVWQKTEQRAGYSLTNSALGAGPVYYGYDRIQPNARLSQYVDSGINITNRIGLPVYEVTALSTSPGGFRQIIGTDIALLPAPPLNAALFSKDPILVLGDSVSVNGDDLAYGSPAPLCGLESAGTIAGNLENISGTPLPDRALSSYSYDMSSLLTSLKPSFSREIEELVPAITKLPDGTYVGNGLSLGQLPQSGDLSEATYVNGPLNISDSTGQGILIVNGDLSISGSFSYYGLIIVKGRIHLNGSGLDGIRIEGAIISSSDLGTDSSILEGIVQINNDSAVIQKQFSSRQFTRLAFWEL